MKKMLALPLILAMIFSMTACGEKSSVVTTVENGEEVYILKMSSTVNEDHLVTKTDRYFIQRVEELSNGRLKIELYPNNQLGDPRSMLEATSMGNLDICDVGLPQYSYYTNALKFFNLPFLWETRDAAFSFLDTDAGEDIRMDLIPDRGRASYISGVELLTPTRGPGKALSYSPEYGGTRGRSAVLLAGARVILYCSGDGTADAKTPEGLRDELVSIGCRYDQAANLRALGLDRQQARYAFPDTKNHWASREIAIAAQNEGA